MRIVGIDHVQLAMPAGGEAAARAFYAGLLGIPEVAKPRPLAGRGGAWFHSRNVRIHLGVEQDFRPARKAHPALLVEGLPALAKRLREAGVEVIDDDAIPGRDRAFVTDPFGNRLELVEAGIATIRRAVPGDEPIVRLLRIQALSDTPEAFESTLERELERTAAEWRRWVAESAIFLLEHPDGPKGIVGGIPHTDDPDGVFLVSMWVHESLRGTGAADALVASVLAWAAEKGARDVWLHVGKLNTRARRLYERNGFRATGSEIVNEEEGAVEVEMRCALGPGIAEA